MSSPFFFSAPPDGTPITERFEWLTDVQISCAGTEQRSYRRAYPRQRYSFNVIAWTPEALACLAALRTEDLFTIPLWPHAIEAPTAGWDAGCNGAGLTAAKLDGIGGYSLLTNAGQGVQWDDAYNFAAPTAVARYAGASRSIAHKVPSEVSATSVAFDLVAFRESVTTAGIPLASPGVPRLTPLTQAGGGAAEQVADNLATFDAGNLVLQESRYKERVYSLDIVLTSRAQLLNFRRFLFYVKGRFLKFKWSPPGEAESTWRLASDAIDIVYVTSTVATCSLTLKKL